MEHVLVSIKFVHHSYCTMIAYCSADLHVALMHDGCPCWVAYVPDLCTAQDRLMCIQCKTGLIASMQATGEGEGMHQSW